MKNVTDNRLRRTVADSIGLDEEKQRAIVDDDQIVSENDYSIKMSATNRDTFDQIINHVLWPNESSSVSASDSIRACPEEDPEHSDTGVIWPERSSTLVLNDVAPTGRPVRASGLAYNTSYHFISEIPTAPKSVSSPDRVAEESATTTTDTITKAKELDGRDALLPAVENSAASSDQPSASVRKKAAVYPKKNSDEMLQTVLTSVPPPFKPTIARYRRLIVGLSAAAVLVAGFTVYLIVSQMDRPDEPAANVVSAVMVQPLADEPGTIAQPISGKVVSRQMSKSATDVKSSDNGAGQTGKNAGVPGHRSVLSTLPGHVKVTALDGTSSGGPGVEKVETALLTVVSEVENCEIPDSGTPAVRLVVDGNGKVITATVVGNSFTNTPAGNCAMETVRKATFPSSDLGSYMIHYAF
jgi:hypothetical protein